MGDNIMPRIYYKDEKGVERLCEVHGKMFDTYLISYKANGEEIEVQVTKDQLIFPKFSELVV